MPNVCRGHATRGKKDIKWVISACMNVLGTKALLTGYKETQGKLFVFTNWDWPVLNMLDICLTHVPTATALSPQMTFFPSAFRSTQNKQSEPVSNNS